MQTTYLRSSYVPQLPSLGNFTRPERVLNRKDKISTSIFAVKRDANSEKGHNHKIVDDNMIVLKMRSQEMKMKEEEANQASVHSGGWIGWEEEWYKNYDSDVYEAIGFLQMWMMKTRPSLVIGVVALLMLSASTSMALVVHYLLGLVM